MKKTLLLIVLLSAVSAPAFAVNLVANGGFETGNLSGWTQSGDTSFTGVGGTSHTGAYGAFFGPLSPGFISQTLATTGGESYNLSLYLRNDDDSNDNAFALWWDGALLGEYNDMDEFDWIPGVGTNLVASGASTELKFGFYNPPSYFYLDDVVVESSVAPVPEPASLLLLGGGLAVGAVMMRRRKAVQA